MKPRREVRSATDAKATLVDGANMFFVDVVAVDFNILKPCKMRSEDAANRTAADDADFHAHAVLRASAPE